MKVAVLYSGGKDSNYALYKASKEHIISCLITMDSLNDESYMFQKPGNNWVKLQARCLDLPLIRYKTKGKKEEELDDLKEAFKEAIEKYQIEGIVTGAIKSVYQASRIQKICYELDLYCFNPLWQIDENEFIEELLENKFEIKIIGVASYPFTYELLGKTIDKTLQERLLSLQQKYHISPAGEGGEFESFVVDGPMFFKKIEFLDTQIHMDSEHSGILEIKKARVVEK